jgi:hypothetical protein
MTAQDSPDTLLSVHTEHPAAIEIRAISPDGYPITLSLRDQDTQRLLERTERALAWLREKGYRPPLGDKQKAKARPNTPPRPPADQLSLLAPDD